MTTNSEDAAIQEIVFLDRDTIAPQIRFSTPTFPHRMTAYGKSRPDQVVERARGATILINNIPMIVIKLRQGYIVEGIQAQRLKPILDVAMVRFESDAQRAFNIAAEGLLEMVECG